jgi:carbon-monoxide dehydrogenase large subunit
MRLLATAFVFGIPETKMRVIAPHVGGGFGCKIFLYPEYCLVAALARKIECPIKWMETRSENFQATTHGRDHSTQIQVGANNDGTITSLKVNTVANLGGTLSTIAPGIPTTLYGRLLSGSYKFPKIYCGVKGVYTNTGMVDAYRGAGRPEATFVVERAMDLVAKKLGMDVLDIRKKKLYSKRSIPLHPGGWNHKRPCL